LAVYAARNWGEPFQRVPGSYINAGFLQASSTEFGFFFAAYPKTPEQASCP
jgi:hypothetical protein